MTEKMDQKLEEKKLDVEIDRAEKEFLDQEKKAKQSEKPVEGKPADKSAKPESTDETKAPAPKPESTDETKAPAPKLELTDFNPWDVLKYPHLTEKSMNMVEIENKLVFIVDRRSTVPEIKHAIEAGFNVKVDKLNVEITQKGLKKVYAKLSPNNDAVDIASRMGML